LKSKFIPAIGIGLGLATLTASCLSGQVGSPPLFTPASVATQTAVIGEAPVISTPSLEAQITAGSFTFTPIATEPPMTEQATIGPVQTVEVKTTRATGVTAESGTPIAFTPTPSSTETALDQGTAFTSTPLPEATPSPTSDDAATQIVELINHERISRALTALVADPRLMAAAQSHSQDMASQEFFDHTGSDGSTPGDRITREDYPWTFFAENLGCGYPTAEAMVQGWLDSPGHRANMLSPQAAHIGIGLAYNPDTDCGYYWTSDFAAGG
jgi:uncharacterized protein YkwD